MEAQIKADKSAIKYDRVAVAWLGRSSQYALLHMCRSGYVLLPVVQCVCLVLLCAVHLPAHGQGCVQCTDASRYCAAAGWPKYAHTVLKVSELPVLGASRCCSVTSAVGAPVQLVLDVSSGARVGGGTLAGVG